LFSYCHYILFTFIDINTLKKKRNSFFKIKKKGSTAQAKCKCK